MRSLEDNNAEAITSLQQAQEKREQDFIEERRALVLRFCTKLDIHHVQPVDELTDPSKPAKI